MAMASIEDTFPWGELAESISAASQNTEWHEKDTSDMGRADEGADKVDSLDELMVDVRLWGNSIGGNLSKLADADLSKLAEDQASQEGAWAFSRHLSGDVQSEDSYDRMSLTEVGMKLNQYDSLREQCARESMGDDWERQLDGMSDEERSAALDGCMDERLGKMDARRIREHGKNLEVAYGEKRAMVEGQCDAHAGTPYETEFQQALDDAEAWRTRSMTVDRLRDYGQDVMDHKDVGREDIDSLRSDVLNEAVRRDYGDFDVDAYVAEHVGPEPESGQKPVAKTAAMSRGNGMRMSGDNRMGMSGGSDSLGFAGLRGGVGVSSAFEQGLGDAMKRDDEASSLPDSTRREIGNPSREHGAEGPSL